MDREVLHLKHRRPPRPGRRRGRPDRRGRPRARRNDDLAEVQHDDLVADVHHEVHVVLDEDDRRRRAGRGSARRARPSPRPTTRRPTRPAAAARARRPAPAPARPASARRRAAGRAAAPPPLDAQLRQPRHRPLPQRGLVPVGARQREQPGPEPGPGPPVGPDHHVLQDGQPGEEPEPLQRPGDAEPGQIMRPSDAKHLPAPAHLARLRPDEPAHHVEQGGLGAVRADHAGDPAFGAESDTPSSATSPANRTVTSRSSRFAEGRTQRLTSPMNRREIPGAEIHIPTGRIP